MAPSRTFPGEIIRAEVHFHTRGDKGEADKRHT